MIDAPLMLDAFCGAGGVGVGYRRAGFSVVGVDSKPQRHYPFAFAQADALFVLRALVDGGRVRLGGRLYRARDFAAAAASPPCQRFSSMTARSGAAVANAHPDLIEPVRELLLALGLPYVIENVPRSPLRDPVTYCGKTMCGRVEVDGVTRWIKRHRDFESSAELTAPACTCHHLNDQGHVFGVYGGGTRQAHRINHGGGNTDKANLAQASSLMGIDWMSTRELTQAIPPAYTGHIGRQLLAQL